MPTYAFEIPTQLDPFIDSTPDAACAETLQRRAEQEGYLFFRGLFNRESVMQVRRDFCAIMQRHGWLAPGTNPEDAIRGRETTCEGDADFMPVFDEFQRLESFHALAHDPTVLAVLERLFGESVLVHPRNIGRIVFPGGPPTPPHQDYLHIRGEANTWTVWVPLGDVPREMGALAVLSRTHKKGLLPARAMPGLGGAGVDTDGFEGARWVTENFRLGDAVMFHSLTIHQGMPSQFPDKLRLSCDYRYQGASRPVVESSLKSHANRQSWDQIYAHWKSPKYQYYWKQMALNLVKPDAPLKTGY